MIMSKFSLFPLGLILVVMALSSCCEKKVYCTSSTLGFAFTGFPRSEVRSFTLKRFYKGDQFGQVLDSAQFIYYGTAPVTARPDTLPFSDYRTVGNLKGITIGNDWAIYLPATGKTYYITTIFDDEHKSEYVRCGDDLTTCTKKITNFSVNNDWQNGDWLYLQKGKW